MDGNWGYAVCALIGAAVGFAELVTRYRDRPSDLLRSLAAWLYSSLNAAAAAGALILIRTFDWDFGTTGTGKPVVQVLSAGFGSLAVFRSSLFSVRVGNADVNIGPSTLITMALNSADLGVNRNQGRLRSRYVRKSFDGIDFDKAKEALPTYCFNLMEGVPEADQARLIDEISELEKAEMSEQMKSYNLGLSILRVTGVSILRAAVIDTKDQMLPDSLPASTPDARTESPPVESTPHGP